MYLKVTKDNQSESKGHMLEKKTIWERDSMAKSRGTQGSQDVLVAAIFSIYSHHNVVDSSSRNK